MARKLKYQWKPNPHRIRKIRKMLREGKPHMDIAHELNVSPVAVVGNKIRMGLTVKRSYSFPLDISQKPVSVIPMNYNTDQHLWETYRKAYPNAKLQVTNGDVTCLSGNDGDKGVLARFSTRIDAVTTLAKAGWKFKTIVVFCAE